MAKGVQRSRFGVFSCSQRRVVVVLLSVILGVAAVTSAGTAAASDPIYVGWSNLLPAWAYQYTPNSANDCAAGRPTCVQKTLKEMQRRFSPLASSCDHNAVFALAYLRTTQQYAKDAAEPGFFNDPAFVNHEDAVFAQFYFQAYDSWAAGDNAQVPQAWQITFNAARNHEVSGAGDLLLGMNAHVNRDLPFVLAALGLVAPDGTSRKPDHDKVNVVLNQVVQPLLAEEAQRFDPTINDAATPYGLSYTALMQLLVSWRETAWRNAERLVSAPDAQARQAVAQQIEDYATTNARSIEAEFQYNAVTTSAQRDAYCATHWSS
jgi:Family of unknown function (DUF5995)